MVQAIKRTYKLHREILEVMILSETLIFFFFICHVGNSLKRSSILTSLFYFVLQKSFAFKLFKNKRSLRKISTTNFK